MIESARMSAAVTAGAAPLRSTQKASFRMPSHSIPPTTLAYMAGLFDGEGSISIVARRERGYEQLFRLMTTVANTHREAPAAFLESFGGWLKTERRQEPHQRIWRWDASGSSSHAALAALRPYLRIKGQRADLAFAFLRFQHEARLRAAQRLRPVKASRRLLDADWQIEAAMSQAMRALNKGAELQLPADWFIDLSEQAHRNVCGYGTCEVEVSVAP